MKLQGVQKGKINFRASSLFNKKNVLLQKGTFRQNLNRTFYGMSFNTTRRK